MAVIRRFIDRDAEILYVPAAQVLRAAHDHDAIAFDVPGVELGHDGPRCSFDAFLRKYGLEDPTLLEAAMPVYDALYTWCRQLRSERHGWYPEQMPAMQPPA